MSRNRLKLNPNPVIRSRAGSMTPRIKLTPGKLILIAIGLLCLGVALPFLMVIDVIPSTFFMNFFSYTASTLGLILGLIGLAYYTRDNRKGK